MENLIRFDWAMKRLLRDKSNYVVLEGFLSTLLEEDVHICKFLESESNQADASDKFNHRGAEQSGVGLFPPDTLRGV